MDEHRVMRGPEAVLEYLREIRDAWAQYRTEVDEILESGDTFVAFMHETGRTHHGGVELQDDTAMVLKVRDLKIAEMRAYLDRREALRAAGLQS